jgi:hypothetical protein
MAFILDDILLAPCKFVTWIGRALRDRAMAELTDESVIQERLLELETQFELGEIGQEQYVEEQDALMRRLNEIHEYNTSRREP